MILMSECITIDYGEKMLQNEAILDWFRQYGWSYDSDTGKMLQGEDQFYINIYQKISAIYFRESGQDFPDAVFGFIVEHPAQVVALVSVGEDDYIDMDSAQEFTYPEFVEQISNLGEGGEEE